MKKALFIIFIFPVCVSAQFTDDFSDGDFTSNPAWSGDTLSWQITAEQLNSNDTIPDSSFYLSTPSSIIDSAQWEFFCNLKLATSSLNYADVFLVSDSANLKGNNSGYFVRIGNTKDEVSLYRKDSVNTPVLIIDGTDGTISSSSNNPIKVKVTRTNTGEWLLQVDYGNTGNYITEGIVSDLTYDTTGFFGVLIKQSSSTFFKKHFFDDFYVGPIIPDTISPNLTDVVVISQSQIELFFDESMDTANLINAIYIIDNGIIVTNKQPAAPNFLSVILDISPPLDSSKLYTVTVLNATDRSQNVININTKQFGIGVVARYNEVVINELFPDPTPVVGLPEKEFVELYNTTNKVISLTNYTFSDASSSAVLPSKVMLPYSYLILCASADVTLLQPYGNVLGLSSWPSLNNDGDDLSLRDADSNLLFSVSYSDSWYADANKKDGGWTLEMIDPANPCGEANNWRASVSASGGTPGSQNSIFGSNPDNVSPSLLRADAIDSVTVWLTFDEPLDFTTASIVSNYSINNGIVVDSVIIQNTTTVILNLSTFLQTGIVYTVTVNNVGDCVSNPLGVNNTADFARPEQGQPGDLIINEVLFNPRENGFDFVEIYNNSNKYINLQGWKIADDDPTPTVITIANPFVIFPGKYAVLTADGANIIKEYPLGKEETFIEMTLPGYNDGNGTVILKTNLTEISDRFDYDEDMHFPLLNDFNGISLERIDFNRPAYDSTNWHSAAENIGFATPGYKNSQSGSAVSTDDPITIDPEIFSPDNDGFNDVVNISYKFDTPGNVANITIYDSKGRLVRYLVQNELLGTAEGTFSWDGINETSEKARIGIYIILFEVFDVDGDVKKYKNTCVLASRL